MLSTEYKNLFLRGLDASCVGILAGRGLEAYKEEFNLFYPVIGKEFMRERNLLIVGQATNGWEPHFTIEGDVVGDIGDLVDRAEAYSRTDDGSCPLEWINKDWTKKEYGLSKSFFWNIAYKTAKKFFGRTDENWNEAVAWSNLMKIAPKRGDGNPDAVLIAAQRRMAADLFKRELEELKPKYVLVLTNLKTWAKPVLDYAFIKYDRKENVFVEACAEYNGSKIIVTRRGYLSLTHDQILSELEKFIKP